MFFGRHITATIFAVAGTIVLGMALVIMNAKSHRPEEARQSTSIDFVPQQKKKETKPPPPKPKPRPRPARSRQAPTPSLATNLSGLGGGLAVFSAADLAGLGNEVMGGADEVKDLVMTADTVDAKPDCSGQPLPIPPNQAVRRGITGKVKVRALVAVNGRLEGIRIIESEPKGIFDDAVTSRISTWNCDPATYSGQRVAMSYELTFPFQ
ncbi:MAG: energy transducer TonB [Myxococcales bacterium]|nr:energy transducer TonB [Myxococcales bacterium]